MSLYKDYTKYLEVHYTLSSAYHSQANGLTERTIRQNTTKYKPFFLMYG
ncbi:16495_t:CDS:2 [Funneliformis geosporum]|uniref:16495_t:CDS:1 n=1 Tax=Funneliformis geosporum TaxID=1117311 RepID=A0A9W4SZ79_9GLOM|nr:16495_t:CDS:2 [Funneliformis geosporum]